MFCDLQYCDLQWSETQTSATETTAMSQADVPPGSTDNSGRTARFGLATATFVVVSSMVGTGVLTTSGFSVYFLGSNQLMLVLWVIGGVLAVCGALTLCELTALIPRSGGDYVYLHESYGPAVAFLSGWVSFFIGFGGPIAASSSAAANYLLVPFAIDPAREAILRPALASAIVLALAVVHGFGRDSSIRAQGGMTVVKLAILLTLAVAGVALGWGRWSSLADRPPITTDVAVTMASSLVYVTYAYTGWNAASYLAGEVDRPQKRMPWAILVGTGLVTLLYLLLNFAYALAIPAEAIRGLVGDSKNVGVVAPIAQIAAERLVGPRVANPLSMAIGLTLIASVSAYVLTGPRVLMAMAASGQFPAFAGRVTDRGAPVLATGLQVTWALILLWTASFEPILLYSSIGLSLFSMLTVSSVFVLRSQRPEAARPFRTPGYPITPLIYLVGTGALVVAVARSRPDVAIASGLSIASGVPVYYAWRAAQKLRARV